MEERKLVSFILIDSMNDIFFVFLVTAGALDCVVSNNNAIGVQ